MDILKEIDKTLAGAEKPTERVAPYSDRVRHERTAAVYGGEHRPINVASIQASLAEAQSYIRKNKPKRKRAKKHHAAKSTLASMALSRAGRKGARVKAEKQAVRKRAAKKAARTRAENTAIRKAAGRKAARTKAAKKERYTKAARKAARTKAKGKRK